LRAGCRQQFCPPGFVIKAKRPARCETCGKNSAPPRFCNQGTKLVDRILAAKQRDPEADTSALEREIDELVYALYGLTPDEIKIAKGAAK
jgi:hypothetical protein